MERILQFLKKHINENIIELKTWIITDAFKSDYNFDEVPSEPGIYIMVSKTEKFIYPKKKSKVFYIGTSNNLKRRLNDHLRYYKKAKEDYHKHATWQYSRYNYSIAFGTDIYYMRITGRENYKSLESKAMESFYDTYGALPVGNGAISYRK